MESERYGALNEHCLHPASLSKVGMILENGQPIGRLFTYLTILIACLTFLIIIIFTNTKLTLESIPQLLFIICCPSTLWLLGKVLYTLLPLTHGIGSTWELNRQTGLVSRFIYDKQNSKAEPQISSVSFAEMDGFIYVTVDCFGYRFLLTLTHRQSNFEVKIGELIGADSMLNECDYLWAFIQHYMGATKPLPDIPLFEEFRGKAPLRLSMINKQAVTLGIE